MGMLDPKRYLTGENNPAVYIGEVFTLLNARITGTVNVNGQDRTEAKLLIATEAEPEPFVCFTTGAAIVAQVQRMDEGDRAKMQAREFQVKVAQVQGKQGRNPANVLVAPDAPDTMEQGQAGDDDIPF